MTTWHWWKPGTNAGYRGWSQWSGQGATRVGRVPLLEFDVDGGSGGGG